MQIDTQPDDEFQARRLDRMESSMRDLNARIARLAMALGVSLQSAEGVTAVMQCDASVRMVPDRRTGVDRRAGSRADAGPDRRVASKWVELRGLLVLRYGLEKSYVDDVGSPATIHILRAAEEQMRREGFRPGVDGVDLRLLDGR